MTSEVSTFSDGNPWVCRTSVRTYLILCSAQALNANSKGVEVVRSKVRALKVVDWIPWNSIRGS